MPTHAPNHLVTHFKSVSAFLSYPTPGYPGRDPPLESYLSQRRLKGGRGTSRVRLPYTGAITMALKPPFSSLYHYPGLSGPEAFLRRRSLHGLSYPWVSGNHTVTSILSASPHCSSPSSLFSTTFTPSFVLSFLPHFDSKGMIFAYPRLFSFVALHSLLNCLGLFTFMHYCVLPLLLSSPFPSPSFWVFSCGWHFLGFYPLFCLGITC